VKVIVLSKIINFKFEIINTMHSLFLKGIKLFCDFLSTVDIFKQSNQGELLGSSPKENRGNNGYQPEYT
jgi:hypothetical protein